MVGVLQVEQSRPIFLPELLLLVVLLREVSVGLERAAGLQSRRSPLKPHLPQKHVQGEGPHHKPRKKRESGSEGLHAGVSLARFN